MLHRRYNACSSLLSKSKGPTNEQQHLKMKFFKKGRQQKDVTSSDDNHDIAADQYYAVNDDPGTNIVNETSTSSEVHLNDLDGDDDGTKDYEKQEQQQQQQTSEQSPQTCKEQLVHICKKESLLVEVLLGIVLAYMYPKLGAVYLFPNVTAHWIAVVIIFFLSGFAIRINELSNAALNLKFNIFVMVYNFLGISFVVDFVAKFFHRNEIVSEDLMKGMIICSCLSMPTNMMVVLSMSANGDLAASLFLATTMNLIGVFITPLLIFVYLGENAEIDFVRTYRSVSLRVLMPVAVGLSLRLLLPGSDAFVNTKKALFTKIRERALVYVVYTTFCVTFYAPPDGSSATQIVVMALSQVILLLAAMVIAWILLFIFFNREPRLRVVGLFGCSMKTAALGIPLISAIYEDHPKLGIFTLPLLIWYPAQLVIGTLLSSRLRRFVDYKLRKYEMERQMNYVETRDCDNDCGLG